MGFARRVVRRSARRAVRKTIRTATPRPVRQAMHPVGTARNAVTPRPVKQVSRAAYTVRHPVGATENAVIGAGLHPRRRRRGLWSWLTGSNRNQPDKKRQPDGQRPVSRPARSINQSGEVRQRQHSAAPSPPPPLRQVRRPARQAPIRQDPVRQQPRRKVEPWPARQAFRTPPQAVTPRPEQPARPPASAGEWELRARRTGGLGDGSRSS